VVSRPQPGAVDSRYRPGREPVRTPVADQPTVRPATPSSARPAPSASPAPRRQPPTTNRYVPRDTTAPAAHRPDSTVTAPNARPRPTTRSTAPVATLRPVTPSLSTRRPVTPTLAGPRSSARSFSSSLVARAGSHYRPHYYRGDHWYHCNTSLWHGYWNPSHCHSTWNHYGWSFGVGCSTFSWSISLWQPFWYCRRSYWDWCYQDALWSSWSQPYYSTWWWYPTTTYCPTYLSVPSTVVVYESAPAAAPAPAPEVVVARSSVVEAARGAPAAGTEELSAGLAKKYVELGDFYFRADRFRDAAEAYGKARSYAPDDAGVHFVLADAVFADGDWHYAAFLITEGLRLDPALASADTDKRTFYGDAKAFAAQMQALDAYLAKAPYDAQAHFVRGYNLAFSGDPMQALAAFRRVLEIEPGHRGATTFVDALQAKAAAPAAR